MTSPKLQTDEPQRCEHCKDIISPDKVVWIEFLTKQTTRI